MLRAEPWALYLPSTWTTTTLLPPTIILLYLINISTSVVCLVCLKWREWCFHHPGTAAFLCTVLICSLGGLFRNIFIALGKFRDYHKYPFPVKNNFCGFSYKMNTCLLSGETDQQNGVGFSSKCLCVRVRVCFCVCVSPHMSAYSCVLWYWQMSTRVLYMPGKHSTLSHIPAPLFSVIRIVLQVGVWHTLVSPALERMRQGYGRAQGQRGHSESLGWKEEKLPRGASSL